MPIEIKELHIKINVNEGASASSGGGGGSSSDDATAQCIEQVMEVLKQQKER